MPKGMEGMYKGGLKKTSMGIGMSGSAYAMGMKKPAMKGRKGTGMGNSGAAATQGKMKGGSRRKY